MPLKTVTMYAVACDCCGAAYSNGEYAPLYESPEDEQIARDLVDDERWGVSGDRLYCGDCERPDLEDVDREQDADRGDLIREWLAVQVKQLREAGA